MEEWLSIQRTEGADWSKIAQAAEDIRAVREYVAPVLREEQQ